MVDGVPVSFRHPADAIRAGLVYVPADRAEALLMQRSVRENIALPFIGAVPLLGSDRRTRRGTAGPAAPSNGSRSTRVRRREVRRLSGGNQQKVTIARWVAGGVRTMLCFDPTRGIDIGTKRQIYALLRELAEAGAAVLLYTSELKEIQLACDRAIVIFNGRVVAEIPVEDADEPTLLRAAYDLPPDAADARGGRRIRVGGREARPSHRRRRRRHDRGGHRGRRREPDGAPRRAAQRAARRNAWTLGLVGVLAVMLAFTKIIQPNYGACPDPGSGDRGAASRARRGRAGDHRHLRRDRPVGRLDHVADGRDGGGPAARARATACAILVVLGVLALGIVVGAINGSLIVVTRVPDIVVTLAMSFVWAGTTLLVLDSPGGGSARGRGARQWVVVSQWIPRAFLLLAVIVRVVWIPLRRSRLGLSMYAIGSSRLAAFRSGVPVGRTKVAAYAIGGLFCAFGGLAINAATGSGHRSRGRTRSRAWRRSCSVG